MRRTTLLLLSCVLALGAAACTDMEDQGVVNDEDPLTSPNGLSSNGLSSNGLSSNGLSSNGLSSNGLSAGALTALRNTAPSGAVARMFFRYVISCALAANRSVTYTWTDDTGTLRTEINPGGLGLAPNWETSSPSTTDKELVTACLAARVNSKGIAVPLSMRAKNVSALSVSSSERSSYKYAEGAYWGNIFQTNPYVYSCSRAAHNPSNVTSQYLTQGRTCTSGACGIITPVGRCYDSSYANSGQACFDRGGSDDWVSSCNHSMNKYNSSSTRVLTTWLLP